MRNISIRPLLWSHLATFVVFCATAMIGYSMILVILRALSNADLAQIHQTLRSATSFQDNFAASLLALSAVTAGWVAATISKARPLIHGALSAAAFFLLFLYWTFHDVFESPQNVVFRLESHSKIAQLAVPLFGILGACLATLSRRASPVEGAGSRANASPSSGRRSRRHHAG
jgi:hypothetical protein